ncbi:AraC family transcriptional regulator (plasmid) [Pedobacter sp. BS3]|uniref:AraC family transcriptional regulator n=1 Tax=Pedobacter sp. BS3 TaxID=2567937 RepID=UPI0011ED34C7|nr:AraC family transcriptional regulator [Pedobacter sp. BS3]TZF86381.1 AraC family transcriptional regulator [Pedobacter sp. BS3]
MKPVLMRHVEAYSESFKSWKNEKPYRHNPWHYHPECEITFIIKGSGILFIGDRVLNYSENELVLIGPNLPHEWRSNIKEDPDNYSQSIAVHFKPGSLGNDFYKIPEMQPINLLLEQSVRGIAIQSNPVKETVKNKLIQLIETQGVERISLLLSILSSITRTDKISFLSSTSFVDSIQNDHDHRINKVYKYVMTNFKNQLSIDQIAAEISMTPTSFCRFFRKRINKSFVQYVNEIRIGYACKLLYEDKFSISQVAFESGFDNLSNFNKQFKKIKQVTPSQFILQISKKSD